MVVNRAGALPPVCPQRAHPALVDALLVHVPYQWPSGRHDDGPWSHRFRQPALDTVTPSRPVRYFGSRYWTSRPIFAMACLSDLPLHGSFRKRIRDVRFFHDLLPFYPQPVPDPRSPYRSPGTVSCIPRGTWPVAFQAGNRRRMPRRPPRHADSALLQYPPRRLPHRAGDTALQSCSNSASSCQRVAPPRFRGHRAFPPARAARQAVARIPKSKSLADVLVDEHAFRGWPARRRASLVGVAGPAAGNGAIRSVRRIAAHQQPHGVGATARAVLHLRQKLRRPPGAVRPVCRIQWFERFEQRARDGIHRNAVHECPRRQRPLREPPPAV